MKQKATQIVSETACICARGSLAGRKNFRQETRKSLHQLFLLAGSKTDAGEKSSALTEELKSEQVSNDAAEDVVGVELDTNQQRDRNDSDQQRSIINFKAIGNHTFWNFDAF